MSVWYCECHGLHGPMAQCVKATRATLTTVTGLGGRVSEAPAREMAREADVEPVVSATLENDSGDSGRSASALSPEAERLAKMLEHFAGRVRQTMERTEAAYVPTLNFQATESLAADFDAIARLLRSPVASLAPRTPWAVSALPLSCDPAWEIGIVGKGAREWFDTRADAERAVALLNVATMPPSSLAPTSLAEIPECVEAAAKAVAVNDGWVKLAPMTRHVAFAKAALRAAEAARPPKGA